MHIKIISQVHFKNNNLHKSTKATNNPHSILLKLRNLHNPQSSHSIKNEQIHINQIQATLPTLPMWFQCGFSGLNPHQPHLKPHSFTRV